MSEGDVIKRFERERPVCVMAQMILDRCLDRGTIDRLFREQATEQYERRLLFSAVARLMASVVLGRQPSVNAAYKKMKEEIGVSLNALYNKLDRVEIGLSQALLRHSYDQVQKLGNLLEVRRPSSIAGYRTRILDGNHLSATEHRLRETRDCTAAPLPGKSLVVLDPDREAIADLFPIEDGHAQERSSLDPVIETVRTKDLWICDRNFCTLKFLYAIDQRHARFVIRQHGQLQGTPVGARKRIGKTATGVIYEQKLQLPEYEGQTLVVRRIEMELFQPTRDGDTSIAILTNLSANEADALLVAEIYRNRWKIETAFLKLTTTLHCEINTLCYPRAALFAFALACVAYNAIALLLTAVRAECGKKKADGLSFYYLGLEIAQTYDGMMVAVPAEHWMKMHRLTDTEFVARLRSIAKHINLAVYRKSTRGPKKPKPPPRHNRKQVHVSTTQILAARWT
jgi:IS4 transposase